jgi:hypothetical protein
MLGRGYLPMAWRATCIMDERMKFIADCLRGELPNDGAV